jgi:hypothetical protein
LTISRDSVENDRRQRINKSSIIEKIDIRNLILLYTFDSAEESAGASLLILSSLRVCHNK